MAPSIRRGLLFGCAAAIAVGLSACNSNHPTSEQIATANFGQYPSDAEQRITSHLGETLFDPYSAHFRFTPPRKVWMTSGLVWNQGITGYGYLEVVYINAKNRFGGYVGERPYYFVYTAGEFHQVTEEQARMFVHDASEAG